MGCSRRSSNSDWFVLLVILFILLIIVGYGYGGY